MIHTAPIPESPTQTRHLVELEKHLESPRSRVETEAVTETSQEAITTEPVLEGLATADRLLITKRLRVKNVLSLRGKRNRFYVRTPDHNLVYTIEEKNSWWVGYFCYCLRPFQLHVSDSLGHEVMRIDRPFACTTRIFPCHLQKVQVFAPPGQRIGSVEQQWTAVRPLYLVKDAEGTDKFWIRGPWVTVSCFQDVQFQVERADGEPVGATCKRWRGLTHAMFMAPVTDRFGVAFDRSLTNEEKGLLLAATLLMEYMYYDV